ncbi:MAG: hypothetical protein ACI3Y0_06035 [Prevotella sp.]
MNKLISPVHQYTYQPKRRRMDEPSTRPFFFVLFLKPGQVTQDTVPGECRDYT